MDQPATRPPLDPALLAERIVAGDRTALARAITLIESTRDDHQEIAQAVLQAVLPMTGKAQRIGITGVPGVGKSSFIEAFGKLLTGQGKKLAVLAVDPSSTRTGGSVLGDKTRMAQLAIDPLAFIRPSPSSGTLGGVGRASRETGLLCEAAGHDVILFETVGVGQSETTVADMVDLFLVLMLPGAGDELQGIKKGLLELADIIAINKADGIMEIAAAQAARQYRNALRLVLPLEEGWTPEVLTISALTGHGLDTLIATIERHRATLIRTGGFERRRQEQRLTWMRALLDDRLFAAVARHPRAAATLAAAEAEVVAGTETPLRAANRILAALFAS